MVCIRDGASASRKGRSRPILSLKRGSCGSEKIALLGGDERDSDSRKPAENQCPLDPIDAFEAMIWHSRNVWDIQRRSLPEDAAEWAKGGGFAGHGKIDRNKADALWTHAMASFAKAGAR